MILSNLREFSFNNSNYFCYFNYYCYYYCYCCCGSDVVGSKVHTTEYVDTMSGNVSLVLATQEVVEGKREVGVDALEEAMMRVGTEL